MDRTVVDNTWYVAIMKTAGNRYESLVASGSSHYKNFSDIAQKNGLEIVAEQFDITDADINRIEGFNESGSRKVRESGLRILTYKLNAGEQIDVQEELTKLATATKQTQIMSQRIFRTGERFEDENGQPIDVDVGNPLSSLPLSGIREDEIKDELLVHFAIEGVISDLLCDGSVKREEIYYHIDKGTAFFYRGKS